MNVTAQERRRGAIGGCRLVDRGPNWLFVRVERPAPKRAGRGEAQDLAEQLLALADRHFVYRIVLEMDGVDAVDDATLDRLDEARERLAEHGGALRLCGLRKDVAHEVDAAHRSGLCNHPTRHGAVVGDPEEEPSGRHPPRQLK